MPAAPIRRARAATEDFKNCLGFEAMPATGHVEFQEESIMKLKIRRYEKLSAPVAPWWIFF
jgi:hypothetical protein